MDCWTEAADTADSREPRRRLTLVFVASLPRHSYITTTSNVPFLIRLDRKIVNQSQSSGAVLEEMEMVFGERRVIVWTLQIYYKPK